MRGVWCEVCAAPLGQVGVRRWHPPGGYWHRVDEDGVRFYRRTRTRGRKWRERLLASIGYQWLPGRDAVGLPVAGLLVECANCFTKNRMMR